MQLTRQADYAVRAVLHLATLGPGGKAATAHIAAEQNIPPTFLAKIISQLASAGVVRAARGAHGGVALARSAEAISLLDIVEAIDGPLQLNECISNPASCPQATTCAVRPVWCEVQADLAARLRQTNFGQLAERAVASAGALA
jgi:Rrf2 family protein